LDRYEVDYQGAQEAFERALSIAHKEADLRLEVRTLAASANVDFYHLMFQRSVEKNRRVIELAHRLEDPYPYLNSNHEAARALAQLGESEQGLRYAMVALEIGEKLHDVSVLYSVLRISATLSRSRGEWTQARGFCDRALQLDPHAATSIGELTLLEYETGTIDQVVVNLERLLEVMRSARPGPGPEYAVPAIMIPLLARTIEAIDQLDIAETAANTVLSSPVVTPIFAGFAHTALALLAVHRNDSEAAGHQYTALISTSGMILWSITQDRLLGLLAQTMGNPDSAIEHFEDALTFCRKAGYRPELAWTCCDYADTLLQRNSPGDRQKAMSLLDECLRITRELGMKPLLERALSRRDILRA
jgi:tetratricopeptide (TPR) repeat protein